MGSSNYFVHFVLLVYVIPRGFSLRSSSPETTSKFVSKMLLYSFDSLMLSYMFIYVDVLHFFFWHSRTCIYKGIWWYPQRAKEIMVWVLDGLMHS